MQKRIHILFFCLFVLFFSGQKTQNLDRSKNDLHKIMQGQYEKDLCTPTNEYGFAHCELYTFTILQNYNILKIDGQTIEKEIKTYSKKMNTGQYILYDEKKKKIGEIHVEKEKFYINYFGFLKTAEEKIGKKGYKFNKSVE